MVQNLILGFAMPTYISLIIMDFFGDDRVAFFDKISRHSIDQTEIIEQTQDQSWLGACRVPQGGSTLQWEISLQTVMKRIILNGGFWIGSFANGNFENGSFVNGSFENDGPCKTPFI